MPSLNPPVESEPLICQEVLGPELQNIRRISALCIEKMGLPWESRSPEFATLSQHVLLTLLLLLSND